MFSPPSFISFYDSSEFSMVDNKLTNIFEKTQKKKRKYSYFEVVSSVFFSSILFNRSAVRDCDFVFFCTPYNFSFDMPAQRKYF